MDTLRTIWKYWRRVGQFIGDWVGRIVLTIFYFTIFIPFALIVRFFQDPLAVKQAPLQWVERTTRDLTMKDAGRQA